MSEGRFQRKKMIKNLKQEEWLMERGTVVLEENRQITPFKFLQGQLCEEGAAQGRPGTRAGQVSAHTRRHSQSRPAQAGVALSVLGSSSSCRGRASICQERSGKIPHIWKEIGPGELFLTLTVLDSLTPVQVSHALCAAGREAI